MSVYNPTVIYRNPNEKRENSPLRYIVNTLERKNTNMNIILTGMPGTGKSYAGISIAEIYSKMRNIPFDVDTHVIHTMKQYLELIRDKDVNQKIKIGSVLILEEPQAEGNARNWQSKINRVMAALFSTFRNQRLFTIMTSPFITFIDKQTRILINAKFRVMGFDENTGITTIKPLFLEYNEDYDKFYKHRLTVRFAKDELGHFGSYKVTDWKIPKASAENLKRYETIKKKFSDNLNEKLYQEVLLAEKTSKSSVKRLDFMRLKELYLENGENYDIFMREFPDISPRTLENGVILLKKKIIPHTSVPQ